MDAREAAARLFGLKQPDDSFIRCAGDIISGRDALVSGPPGINEEILQVLPGLCKGGLTLCVCSRKPQMKSRVDALNAGGIPAAYINSDLSPKQTAAALSNAARGRYKVIFVPPGRLLSEDFLSFAAGADISVVSVLSADHVSRLSEAPLETYLGISQFMGCLPRRPVLAAFCRAVDPAVGADIVRQLGMKEAVRYKFSFAAENIYLSAIRTSAPENALCSAVASFCGSGVVFVPSYHSALDVCSFLSGAGISCSYFNRGMPDEQRQSALAELEMDRVRVLVADTAFRGMTSKSNISFVIHHGLPPDAGRFSREVYLAGRDGSPADSLLIWSEDDLPYCRDIARRRDAGGRVPGQAERELARMTGYARSEECLRAALLDLMGQEPVRPCGHCCVCDRQGRRHARRLIPDELLGLRRQLSLSAGFPPYAVISDNALLAVNDAAPRSTAELSVLDGVTEHIVRTYGRSLTEIMNGPVRGPSSE